MLTPYQRALICSSGSIATSLFFLIHGPSTSPSLCFSLELTVLPPSPRPCSTSHHELPKRSLPSTVPHWFVSAICPPPRSNLSQFLLAEPHSHQTVCTGSLLAVLDASLMLSHPNTIPLEKGFSQPLHSEQPTWSTLHTHRGWERA